MGATCSVSSPCCSENINYSDLVPINGVIEKTESSLYQTCQRELEEAANILRGIEEYKGCQELARAAMKNPTDETRLAAFEGLLPVVDQINDFLEYSKAMTRCYKMLLENLSQKVIPGKQLAQLSDRPGLTSLLTEILDFALKFDQIRIKKPNVSNDFSYYKRLSAKFSKHPGIKHDDEKQELQKFIQSSTPMTLALIEASKKVNGNYPACVYILSTIANAYLVKLGKQEPYNTHDDLARAMTLAVVIFDWIDTEGGAFVKRSPIKIKQIIKLLKTDWAPCDYVQTIQFGSMTFRNAPYNIQELFD